MGLGGLIGFRGLFNKRLGMVLYTLVKEYACQKWVPVLGSVVGDEHCHWYNSTIDIKLQ